MRGEEAAAHAGDDLGRALLGARAPRALPTGLIELVMIGIGLGLGDEAGRHAHAPVDASDVERKGGRRVRGGALPPPQWRQWRQWRQRGGAAPVHRVELRERDRVGHHVRADPVAQRRARRPQRLHRAAEQRVRRGDGRFVAARC